MLAETFHGDWAAGSARDFARRAALHARRRRGLRQAILGAGTIAGLAAVLFIVLHRPATDRLAPPPGKVAPAYEIISDDDFIALLRDRPALVLPQENGTKKIVLLAGETAS